MKKIVALAMIAAAAALAPRGAHAQQVVTCESINNQRQVCGVDNVSGVSLRHQLSGNACVQGQTWGLTRNAIWVSRGCRAEFNVTQYSTGYGSGRYGNTNDRYNNRYNNRYDNRNGNNATASAAALCRRAVRSQMGNVNVNAWQTNGSANNPRYTWRASNGRAGTCRVDRNGNVTLRYSR